MMKTWRWMAMGLIASTALAGSPFRVPVPFSYETNTGIGVSLFVVGSAPQLGSWNPTGAVKLAWTPGNVWTGQVALEADTTFEYKYIARYDSEAEYCNNDNVLAWMPANNLTGTVPSRAAAPYIGKAMYYHSSWTNVDLLYWIGEDMHGYAMTRIGEGRAPGEFLYYAEGFGVEGGPMMFIPNGYLDDVHYWDNAPDSTYGGNYYTPLDVFFLQDGSIYDYWPPASVGAPRIVTTNVVSSWEPDIPSRTVRIYLPRGYDQNAAKRYPVLYMHDGQNIFAPGGPFGCWGAESAATREIGQGRMRETIIVGVDNNTPNRTHEYLPPTDRYGGRAGVGHLYANFLLHNVKPTLDWHYRTLPDPSNTLTMGSSMGGVISLYLGMQTNGFGILGPMSTAGWIAPNLMGWIESNATAGLRIYMDWGTDESTSDIWEPNWRIYDALLMDGYAPHGDLLEVVGCGHEHNEAAWSNRLPAAFNYMMPVTDGPNQLAPRVHQPSAMYISRDSSALDVVVPTLHGWTYILQAAPTLPSAVWTPVDQFAEPDPWGIRTLRDTNAHAPLTLYRVSLTN